MSSYCGLVDTKIRASDKDLSALKIAKLKYFACQCVLFINRCNYVFMLIVTSKHISRFEKINIGM